MRRKSRKTLVQLVVFLSLLSVILIINRPQSSTENFSWNQIRYRTSAPKLPESRGICPGLAENKKPVLVVSRVEADGDHTWITPLEEIYHPCVYTADRPTDTSSTQLQVPSNRGHESMAYLTFLIDNYSNIPAAGVVFVHGNRYAWHNDHPDYDNLSLLKTLNISAALKPWGYHNMRCDWSASTCHPSGPPQRSLETSAQAAMVPWDAKAVSDAALPHALATLFGGKEEHAGRLLIGRTDAIRSQCCAQFVVARKSIWKHSREEYIALRQWLLDGSIDNQDRRSNTNAAPGDDRVAGRILSYAWHILFIQQSDSELSGSSDTSNGVNLKQLNMQACPRADDCYCRLYGRCDIRPCTNPGSCYGQYRLPSNYRLPDDWANTHKQNL